MKLCTFFYKLSCGIAFTTILFCCSRSTQIDDSAISSRLEQLYISKEVFKLRNEFLKDKDHLSEANKLLYSALINNTFDAPETSNKELNTLITSHRGSLKDSVIQKLHVIKLDNYIKLFDYGNAARESEFILKNYTSSLDSSTLKNIENELKIWKALEHRPKQIVIKSEDTYLKPEIDKAGLQNLKVKFPSKALNFIFDTGANFSVVQRSVAKELGMELVNAQFNVTAFSGEDIKSDIAIAEVFHLGSIEMRNVVFLVFDDKDLAFPQIEYEIKGILGFPEIKSLEEIHFRKNNEIFIPQTAQNTQPANLAYHGLTPMVASVFNEDTLIFTFDTGANHTQLHAAFFDKYGTDPETHYERKTISMGSAGGVKDEEGLIIPTMTITVGNKEGVLTNVTLMEVDNSEEKSQIFGNLGQDFIRQFDEMIINFKSSSLSFN